MNNTFKINIPGQLIKGKDGTYRIRGIASTASVDKQGETILQEGMDLTPVDQGKGLINWDHGRSPECVIGSLDSYARTPRGLFIEGTLFKGHPKADAVHAIMNGLEKSGKKGVLGFSVEGKILKRNSQNPKIIEKCMINAVAATFAPVNPETSAELAKSMSYESEEGLFKSLNNAEIEFNSTGDLKHKNPIEQPAFTATQVVDIVEKALGVGAGYTHAPSSLAGGDAMAQSSMTDKKRKKKKKGEGETEKSSEENDAKNLDVRKALKKGTSELFKSHMIEILSKLQELYPNNSRSELWSVLKQRMQMKFPDIND